MTCPLCSGACAGADLSALTRPDLQWLWTSLAAAADRRGDKNLTGGAAVTVTVPAEPAQRAAAAGLLGDRHLAAGQRRRVDLTRLTAVLAERNPQLTPGVVVAHAVGRPLAATAAARAHRASAEDDLRARLQTAVRALPEHVRARVGLETVFERLRSSRWVSRILSTADPEALVAQALEVAARLPEPGARIDRRTLVPGAPHALDGGALAGLVLALCGVANGGRPRAAWASLGVDCDDLVGGLIVTGVAPAGWSIPAGATVTLPPRELAAVSWAAPASEEQWVFVTENPSVLAAANALAQERSTSPARVVCYSGTPSAVECSAIAALAAVGWSIAVRADFDAAGIAHVRALLEAAPAAVPWRMSAADYLAVAGPTRPAGAVVAVDTPWDAELGVAMVSGAPVYEEDLLPDLVADIAEGHPPARP
ncbi:MAG TPA: DUF2399 domain-containing protein [Jatrophihabitans sp.]|jgi:uncharacterized protein (TIGR02679 family)|uniref:DUF2399 domain-containing protein n=1 Tax=Jatrophihabitans sp. TaxID=1932789 RepID=UPI002F1C38AC